MVRPFPYAPLHYGFRWRKLPELYEDDPKVSVFARQRNVHLQLVKRPHYDYHTLEIVFYQPVDIKEIKFRNNFASNLRIVVKKIKFLRKRVKEDEKHLPWRIAINNLVLMEDPESLEGGYELFSIPANQCIVPLFGVIRMLFSVKQPGHVGRKFDLKRVSIIGRPTFPEEGIAVVENIRATRRTVYGFKSRLAEAYCPKLRPPEIMYADRVESEAIFGSTDMAYIGDTEPGHFLLLFFIDQGLKIHIHRSAFDQITYVIDKEDRRLNIGIFYKNTHMRKLRRQTIVVRTLEEMANLKFPRIILLAHQNKDLVDRLIKEYIPLIHPFGIIIDVADSDFNDTQRRCEMMKKQKMLYLALAVKGAVYYMECRITVLAGGTKTAWPYVKHLFENVSMRINKELCCAWIGDDACAHFGRMVLDSIEFMEVQLIFDIYNLMKNTLVLDHDSMSQAFHDWNEGMNKSYLMDITSIILKCKYKLDKDEATDLKLFKIEKFWYKWPLLMLVHITKEQRHSHIKGINQTALAGTRIGTIFSTFHALVSAKYMSVHACMKLKTQTFLPGPESTVYEGDKEEFIRDIFQAIYLTRIIYFTQLFMMVGETSKAYNWNINYSNLFITWKGYEMTRSAFLDVLRATFEEDPNLLNLFEIEFFQEEMKKNVPSLRRVVATAVTHGIALPICNSALAYYDGYRTEFLPANLLQAMRSYLGYCTLEINKFPGRHFELDWKSEIIPKWLGP